MLVAFTVKATLYNISSVDLSRRLLIGQIDGLKNASSWTSPPAPSKDPHLLAGGGWGWRVNLFSVLYLEIRLTVFVGHSEKKKKSCTWYLLLWCQYCSSVLVSRRVQNNLDALLASRTLVWYWALDKCASAVLGGSGREPPYRVDTGVIVWKWPCVLPLVTCLMLMVTSHHWPFPHNYPPAIYQIGFFFFSRLASILKVQVRCSHDRKEVLFCGDGMVKKKKKRILSIAVWPNDLDFCLYICSVFHIFVLFQNLFDILQWSTQ